MTKSEKMLVTHDICRMKRILVGNGVNYIGLKNRAAVFMYAQLVGDVITGNYKEWVLSRVKSGNRTASKNKTKPKKIAPKPHKNNGVVYVASQKEINESDSKKKYELFLKNPYWSKVKKWFAAEMVSNARSVGQKQNYMSIT